ncbi:NAD(P)-binding protein [Karstenula rhodostoma CBS 690.94]|uniref:NAD(P)-binding protein n=1 Tax=Karstenula rhodostoma CBS 690.94 TaxID=1392251 RepID=A0A9P4PP86_9PLEO|nr:NAD(P)-binding protein [Karstenula rhodostoma CBS 690.94]
MSSTNPPRLGWFGLGSMGLAMACNLQEQLTKQNLPALHFANRSLSKGDTLKELGGIPCQDISELVQACDVIFISVTNDEVLTSVINQFTSTNSLGGKILVDTTTVHPNTTASLATKLASHNCSFIAAPVFGPPLTARAGQLLIAVAGPPQVIEIITPYLQGVIARGVIRVGEDPSKALLLKSTSNFIGAGLMYLLSEAHVLAEKAGLPASVLESLIEANFGAYAANTSKRLTSGSYMPAAGQAPNSALELAIKDVGIGLGIANEQGVRLEVGELSMGAMEEARAFGEEKGRKLDSHSVFGVVRKKAGLRFENEAVKKRDGLTEHDEGGET